MKMFLRDMPTPLLPMDMYSDFLAVANMDPDDRTKRLIELICRLPKYNQEMLRTLMKMLYQIQCNQHINAMDGKNLGIVTAPNILRNNSRAQMTEMNAANTVIGTMIEQYELIFERSVIGNEVREAAIASKEWVLFKRKLLGTQGGVRVMVANPDRNTVLALDSHGDCVLFDSENCTFIRSESVSKNLSTRVPPSAAIFSQGKFWIAFMNILLVLDGETLAVVHMANIPAQSIVAVGEEVWVGGESKITVLSAADFSVLDTLLVKKRSIVAMVAVNGQVWGACKRMKKNERMEMHQWNQKDHAHVSHFITDTKDVFAMTVLGKNTVWTASDNPCVSVWDTETKECLARISTHPVAFSICALGDQVWFGSRDEIGIIDPKTYKCVGELRGYHQNLVFSTLPIVRSDHIEIWSGSFDKSVCIWSVTPLPRL